MSKYVIFDTNAVFLQWSGETASADDAIRSFNEDVVLADETIDDLLVGEVSDAQLDAIEGWWDDGGHASECPPLFLTRIEADRVREALKTAPSYFDTYLAVCDDPATRYVLRGRAVEDNERDPVDALHDAETLLQLAQMRVAEMRAAA